MKKKSIFPERDYDKFYADLYKPVFEKIDKMMEIIKDIKRINRKAYEKYK